MCEHGSDGEGEGACVGEGARGDLGAVTPEVHQALIDKDAWGVRVRRGCVGVGMGVTVRVRVRVAIAPRCRFA